ncbi:MAG: zinc ribbon domain-containing protein [Candidatus Freyarchaeum deiterrae]
MSLSYETDYSRDEIIAECSSRLRGRYYVKQEGNLLKATDGRDYSTGAIILCVIGILTITLIGVIAILVYWFTRTQNKIIIDITNKGKFTIMYEGKKATEDALGLSNMLRSSEAQTVQSSSTKCPNCGFHIIEGASYCAECGQEIH